MDHTLGYRLFGTGKLPAEIRASIAATDILAEAEGIRVEERFAGDVPGLHEGGRTFRFSGALVFSRARIVATLGSWTAIDAAWEGSGPVRLGINDEGLVLQADVSHIDPQWRGDLTLVYHRPFTREEQSRFPALTLTCAMSREHVLQLAGARPKVRE
jgi:hypothetical protein